jgi:hypothetical protein
VEGIVGSALVKVVCRLGIGPVGHKHGRFLRQGIPVYTREKRVMLHLRCPARTQPLCWVGAHESIHEVVRFGRDINLILVPVDSARDDIVKDLFGRLSMERREAV